MSTTLPISAADLIEFRPNAAAVLSARTELASAQEKYDAAHAEPAAGQVAVPEAERAAIASALTLAQNLLADAEARLEKSDPAFMLRVPTGRTKALIIHAANADPHMPRFRSNAALLRAIADEVDRADLSDDERTALDAAQACIAEGRVIPNESWMHVFTAAQQSATGRIILADRQLSAQLEMRHRLSYCVAIPGRRAPLTDRDLDAIPEQYHGAIHAEILRLGELSEDAAKNFDAP